MLIFVYLVYIYVYNTSDQWQRPPPPPLHSHLGVLLDHRRSYTYKLSKITLKHLSLVAFKSAWMGFNDSD